MAYRTELQIALLVVGMIVWGYGQRSQNTVLQYTGLGFFAAAVALRLFKKKASENDEAPGE
jgi:hypothetical protein